MPEPTKASPTRKARLRQLLAYQEIPERMREAVKRELDGGVSHERAHDIICDLSAAIARERNYPKPGDRSATVEHGPGPRVDDPQDRRKDLHG